MNGPKRANASLLPDPERALLIRQAFEDFATARYMKQDLLARLTAAGFRSRQGKAVQPPSGDFDRS